MGWRGPWAVRAAKRFGTKAGDLFTKITIGVAAFWIVICIFAAMYAPYLSGDQIIATQNPAAQQNPAGSPAAPPAGKAVESPAGKAASSNTTTAPAAAKGTGATQPAGKQAEKPSANPANPAKSPVAPATPAPAK